MRFDPSNPSQSAHDQLVALASRNCSTWNWSSGSLPPACRRPQCKRKQIRACSAACAQTRTHQRNCENTNHLNEAPTKVKYHAKAASTFLEPTRSKAKAPKSKRQTKPSAFDIALGILNLQKVVHDYLRPTPKLTSPQDLE